MSECILGVPGQSRRGNVRKEHQSGSLHLEAFQILDQVFALRFCQLRPKLMTRVVIPWEFRVEFRKARIADKPNRIRIIPATADMKGARSLVDGLEQRLWYPFAWDDLAGPELWQALDRFFTRSE